MPTPSVIESLTQFRNKYFPQPDEDIIEVASGSLTPDTVREYHEQMVLSFAEGAD